MIQKYNTPKSILHTDFYQFTMSFAYLMTGYAGEITGFESFIRNVKPAITNKDFYLFYGENEVHEFMAIVKEEINKEDFFDRFWSYIEPKFKEDKIIVNDFYIKAKNEFNKIDKTFEYSVVKNNSKVYPKVPVFQFKGPKIIGQMIETPITNIINGVTGFNSFKNSFPKDSKINILEEIIFSEELPVFYKNKLIEKSIEYRNATSKILFEAGYRRAPSFNVACFASKNAIENNWNGSSNTCLYFDIDSNLIGGTMAHAFIMSYEFEEEAFIAWNNIYPKSTILIDTYDSVEAVKKLIKLNIRPIAVRIDSDPIEEIAINVRKELDSVGWNEVKIFLSGDITPEKLIKWEKDNIPFDMCMAGTKYVNLDEAQYVNAGFVYKIVEFTRNGKTFYPVKKSFGKSNFPGLKTVIVDKFGNINMSINKNSFGFNNIENISNNAKVSFQGV